MNTSVASIGAWFDRGVAEGATHMIVVCDSFDHEDYPVFVKPTEDVREVEKKYRAASMQRVMEVYSLTKDKAEQTKPGTRVFNY